MDPAQYYEFIDPRRAVTVLRPDTPAPWINYLSNGSLHAFVSQAGGGMCWWRHPSAFRLTRYRMYNLPTDSPGFYVYIRRANGQYWSPTFRPCSVKLNEWRACHQPGSTSFTAQHANIHATLTLFIAPDYDVMVWDLTLTNTGDQLVRLDVFAYVELSLHEWLREARFGYYFRDQLRTWYDPELESLLYLCHTDDHPRLADVPLVFFSSTLRPSHYDGDRGRFVGAYRDERNPIAVERGECQDSSLQGGDPCAALQVPISLRGGDSPRLSFFLGVAPGALSDFRAARDQAADTLQAVRSVPAINEQKDRVSDWWEEHLRAYQCFIPEKDAERQVNTWNPVQCVHTGRYSRSVSSSASGVRGVGYRDTAQDMLAIAYRKPDWARRMLRYLLSQQFEDGHAVHSSFPEQALPPEMEPVRSDDHLWPIMLAHAVASETGDLDFLHDVVPFLGDDGVSQGPAATVWDHLLRAADFTEQHLGHHGIPLTLGGDWNDVIGRSSRKGTGESVFAGQQYRHVLRLLHGLALALHEEATADLLHERWRRQRKALSACAWDGGWWLRGFDDDGRPIGGRSSSHGTIFLNPQCWAVISMCGTDSQLQAGMDAVAERLDTDVGLRILAPSYPTYPEADDPFSGYSEGTGENGSIFCQPNGWAVIAEALRGNATRAWKYYLQLIPHIVSHVVGPERYQAEPYAYVSSLVGPDNPRFGHGSVNQVTGAAAWMDIAATQYLLGIRPRIDGLLIDPCIPPNWRGFVVSRLWRGCRLTIRVRNPGDTVRGVVEVSVNDSVVLGREPGLVPPETVRGMEHAQIDVVMGQMLSSFPGS
jgi:cellobiose phosphorylase